jgi:D-apionolactonase
MDGALSRAVMLCGTEHEDPPARLLRAGPLSVEFENGALRYVRFGGTEVLRAIAFLVRDENWGTFMPTISDLEIEEGATHFAVSYHAVCADARQRLTYRAMISGTSDGALAFQVTAQAETEILTNRTGFVVLHPGALAGRAVKVTHSDGRVVMARFPELISPGQPLLDIRALDHEVAPGVWASCDLEGDSFEMEDQRNWGDASYKTYVGSLLKPWPYTLAAGSRHTQAVRLSVAPSGPMTAPAAAVKDSPLSVEVAGGTDGRLPAVGIGVPASEAEHALAAIDLLRRLAPRYLICHIDLRGEVPQSTLEAYRHLAEATGAQADLEIIIADDSDPAAVFDVLAQRLAAASLKPASLAVSTAADLLSWQPGQDRPTQPTAQAICSAARSAFPGAKLGGGVFTYFTEINRKRPPVELLDHVSHTTCSIVHAADDRSVMETLETLPAMIASTRAFIGERSYRIGPSAIACRSNPYGAAPFENPHNGRVSLARVDPRQRGLFGAAFLVGYAAACARGGLDAMAFGAPTGPFGFIYRRAAYAQPWFDGRAGDPKDATVYPAYHVVAALSAGSGRPLLATEVSRPGVIEALGWRENGHNMLWIANLTAAAVEVTFLGPSPATARGAVLDAQSFARATRDPEALAALARPLASDRIRLDGYAVARIDWPSA